KSLPRRSRASSTTSATCSRPAMSNSIGPSAPVAGARDGSERRCARRSAKDTSGGIAEGDWKPPTTKPERDDRIEAARFETANESEEVHQHGRAERFTVPAAAIARVGSGHSVLLPRRRDQRNRLDMVRKR